jgi:hypothetical protein
LLHLKGHRPTVGTKQECWPYILQTAADRRGQVRRWASHHCSGHLALRILAIYGDGGAELSQSLPICPLPNPKAMQQESSKTVDCRNWGPSAQHLTVL